jgi:glutamyl-Q tRNA(Asp) synthetase
VRTRFAPSPTGPLHLGHAFSALTAWDRARAAGGRFLLRIEDIDTARARPAHEAAIFEDLRWLGLDWPQPVLRQSARQPAYDAALSRLAGLGLIYPCRCTRADIAAALSAPQEERGRPPRRAGPDGTPYPGTCRGRSMASRTPADALRLDLARALAHPAAAGLCWQETGLGAGRHPLDAADLLRGSGDVVLARRDIGTSYHLAVVVDDAAQGITDVVRGVDLAPATPLHRLLQALLGLPAPRWHHHRLIRDADGHRLAKRDDARALALYRADGCSPDEIRRLVGLPPQPASGAISSTSSPPRSAV